MSCVFLNCSEAIIRSSY